MMTGDERMKMAIAGILAWMALPCAASAQAPTPAPAQAPGKGYVEVVAQSAFGNVTSQSFGGEFGITVLPGVQLFVEAGQVNNVATAEIGAAAAKIAGYLSQTQANVGYTVKQPATFGAAGVKLNIPVSGRLQPYIMAGGGVAKVKQDVRFSVGGTDVTSNLTPYNVVLGTDLSGTFTKPMAVVGIGVMWPAWQRLVLDFQYRYGRIFADGQAINVSRAGLGFGVRF
jgi:opacity protein-like surface antigen